MRPPTGFSGLLVVSCYLISLRPNLSTGQLLLPNVSEGCMYIPEPCTTVVLVSSPRNDSCHRQEGDDLARQVSATDAVNGVQLVFYGDSITKQWRTVDPVVNGIPQVWTQNFGNYSAAILGVGEDQSAHLLWRLQHGEVFTLHQPEVIVLLIGTNDLGAAASCAGEAGAVVAVNGTAARIQDVVGYLRMMNPNTHIVLMGILPWGLINENGVYVWPNQFTKAIGMVNQLSQAYAVADPFVHYIDCGHQLFPTGQVLQSIASDGLHPNAEGMATLAKCISSFVYEHAPGSILPLSTAALGSAG